MDFLIPFAMAAVGSVLSNGLLSVPRPNRVDVAAAKQASYSVRPIIPYRAPTPYTGGRVRALFIGINYTGTSSQLSGCVNDVHQMLGTLQRIHFPISECCILVDDPKFPNMTAYPTRENILKYMAWLTHDVRPGDVLFLHYSGHGGQTKGGSDSEEQYDQTLVPMDYQQKGCILDDDLFIMLIKHLPAGVRMTCVFDCCHSATMLDLPFSFIATQQVAGGRTGYCMKPVRRDNFSNGDVLMFSGCDDSGTSADVRDTGRGNAGGAATQAFTWALVNTSGLSIMDMLLKTREILRQKKFKQVPQLTASKPVDLYKPFFPLRHHHGGPAADAVRAAAVPRRAAAASRAMRRRGRGTLHRSRVTHHRIKATHRRLKATLHRHRKVTRRRLRVTRRRRHRAIRRHSTHPGRSFDTSDWITWKG
ncbi:metacaspase [Strigomonas culicis]|uniref:Metacaspase n=1 Tax=Strigomonas culicis TaxID=28005 RepID=S9UAN5_9TRYP|nr:metacaspase [Strigomonas culicis]|eukprot:EPY27857.1 metacaspase [Strigomonas culicis]